MEEYEVYDKYFIDEEYNLEDAPNELYSYRAGWNDALKRAAIVVRHDIRCKGKWIKLSENLTWHYECSECHTRPLMSRLVDNDVLSTFCPNCGALMTKGEEDND